MFGCQEPSPLGRTTFGYDNNLSTFTYTLLPSRPGRLHPSSAYILPFFQPRIRIKDQGITYKAGKSE